MKSRHFQKPSRVHVVALLFALGGGICAEAAPPETWVRHAIDPADPLAHRTGADGVKTGDLNGDERTDFVTGWEEGGKVRICLHPGPEFVRDPWPALTVGKVRSPEDAVFADLDGDGRLDVVSACEGKERRLHVHWAPAAPEAVTSEAAWTTSTFATKPLLQWWMQILPRDLDGDGDIDLIAGSKNAGGSVTCLLNPGDGESRNLSQWETTPIADAGWIMTLDGLAAADREWLVYSDRKGKGSGIWIAPFLDDAPWIGTPQRVAAASEEVMFLDLADTDGDGRDEILAAIKPASIRVYQSAGDPLAPWKPIRELPSLPWDRFGTVKAVQWIGNGTCAITCENANDEKCGMLLASADGIFTAIGGAEGTKFDRIEWLDLDGDGDKDLVTCEERDGLGVVWYENPENG